MFNNILEFISRQVANINNNDADSQESEERETESDQIQEMNNIINAMEADVTTNPHIRNGICN